MAEVNCTVEEAFVQDNYGNEVPGVIATCGDCQHQTESFGTGEGSVRRCLALMREECPQDKRNFYVGDL